MPPQRPNLVLTSHIPHIKLDILIRHALHVEADGRDGRHVLAQLELVQDGGLAGGVKAEHEEAHFFGSKDLAHYFGELATHFFGPLSSFSFLSSCAPLFEIRLLCLRSLYSIWYRDCVVAAQK